LIKRHKEKKNKDRKQETGNKEHIVEHNSFSLSFSLSLSLSLSLSVKNYYSSKKINVSNEKLKPR